MYGLDVAPPIHHMTEAKKIVLATVLGILFTAAVVAISFFFSSYYHTQDVGTDTEASEEISTAPISMTAGNLPVDGIEGSYCTMQLCVDKVGPTGFTDVTFTPIPGTDVVITLRDTAREITIGLRDENGDILLCDMRVEKQTDTTYTATICNDPGQSYYVDVSAWWTEGDDAAYYFPVTTP